MQTLHLEGVKTIGEMTDNGQNYIETRKIEVEVP